MRPHHYKILLFRDSTSRYRELSIHRAWVWLVVTTLALGTAYSGAISFAYFRHYQLQDRFAQLEVENRHLKGEARILVDNLARVKTALTQVNDYARKITDIVGIKARHVGEQTGIGPLTPEEYDMHRERSHRDAAGGKTHAPSRMVPLGVSIDSLVFRPVLEDLSHLERSSQQQATNLQNLLSLLSEKKSILFSVPSIAPVKGWVTSGFGIRTSPFTGKRRMHRAVDIAAPVGTPILAPADGVVIFSGHKEGFGNFIMLAHYGYGIVTRYGHNAHNMVRAGQKVERGDQLATVGMTGRTTGPHLHYEVWINGAPTDPTKFMLDEPFELF